MYSIHALHTFAKRNIFSSILGPRWFAHHFFISWLHNKFKCQERESASHIVIEFRIIIKKFLTIIYHTWSLEASDLVAEAFFFFLVNKRVAEAFYLAHQVLAKKVNDCNFLAWNFGSVIALHKWVDIAIYLFF